MDDVVLKKIEFVNKGEPNFEEKKQPLSAESLNLMQSNVEEALEKLKEKTVWFAVVEEWEE